MTRCGCAWVQIDSTRYLSDPTLNDILHRPAGIRYLTLIDTSFNYHKLKIDG